MDEVVENIIAIRKRDISSIIRKTICSTIVKRSDVFSKRNVFFLFPLHYKNNVIIIAF